MDDKTYGITDIGTWWGDNKGTIFRYQVYRRGYTPYEMDKKFSDESLFEDDYHYAYIDELMEIPNDILIAFEEVNFAAEGKPYLTGITYYEKLSNIKLSKFNLDNEQE